MAKKKVQETNIKESSSSKSVSLFDILNYLTYDKKPYVKLSEEDIKQISPYMINRFISMNADYLPIVNEFQQFTASGILSPREVYKLYFDILPKSKQYFRYVKGAKEEKYNTKLVDIICIHLKCSKKECLEYLDILEKNTQRNEILTKLLNMYAIPEKEISKII